MLNPNPVPWPIILVVKKGVIILEPISGGIGSPESVKNNIKRPGKEPSKKLFQVILTKPKISFDNKELTIEEIKQI